jgi:hypothetical protein
MFGEPGIAGTGNVAVGTVVTIAVARSSEDG